jgi:hypothetical protein
MANDYTDTARIVTCTWKATLQKNNEGTPNWFYCEIQKSFHPLCNNRETILILSVQKLLDRAWIAAFTGTCGVATLKPRCVMLWICAMGNHCAEGCDTGQVMNLKLSEMHLLPLMQLWRAGSHIAPGGEKLSEKLWYAYILEFNVLLTVHHSISV